MNAQNSSRVPAASCGTIQATARRLAAAARLAHFLTLEKRAFEKSGAQVGKWSAMQAHSSQARPTETVSEPRGDGLRGADAPELLSGGE